MSPVPVIPGKSNPKVALGILTAAVEVTAIVAWIADAEILGVVTIGLPEVAGVVTLGGLILAWATWPSLRLLSRSARFKDLHLLIGNELRMTQNDVKASEGSRRNVVDLGVARLGLVHPLLKLGISPPHPEDLDSWLTFLAHMATYSRTGDLRNARRKYATPELFYKWKSDNQ